MISEETTQQDDITESIYIPDNDDLLAVLDGLPKALRPYRDHAALLIYFAGLPKWIHRRNENDDFTRLHSLILRKYIPCRKVKLLRDHLKKCGILELDGYSAGNYSKGYRIAERFNGLPFRWGLSDKRLIQKRQTWRESVISIETPIMRELAERRKPVTDAMRRTLDNLNLSEEPLAVERALRGKGIDPAHLRYACSAIAHRDHDGLYMDPFGWRVHSIITRTTSKLRPFLRFHGDSLIELDVRNAQPLILAAALRNPPICATYIGNAQHIAGRSAGGSALGILRSIPEREVNEYLRL